MTDEGKKCVWCGSSPALWHYACESCYRIFERVDRALSGTRFTPDERRAFSRAIIQNPHGLEAAKLRWIEEYRTADQVKASVMDRDLNAIRRLCGEGAPRVQ